MLNERNFEFYQATKIKELLIEKGRETSLLNQERLKATVG